MDRNKYLELCQLNSIKIKHFVFFEKRKYFPKAYELSFKLGKPVHTAILKDVAANSIVRVDLKGVKYE